MTFTEQIKQRFSNSNVQILSSSENFDIILFEVEYLGKKYLTLSTSGLNKYTMPVSPKYAGKEHIELCFCFDADWDFEDEDHQWPIEKLNTLGNYLLEKQTWFGAGHTIPNGNPPQPLSKTVTQDYFFFDEATFLHKIFNSFYVEETLVNFLFIIPITKDELAFKQKKNTFGFKKKLASKNVHEVVEEFRPSSVVKKWMFW
jgi:hypothetical protein